MTNTTVLITGANRGIGLSLAQTLLSRPSHTIIATTRTPTTTTPLSTLPPGPNSNLIILTLDSSIESDPASAIKTLAQDHGITKLDIVIANAAILLGYERVEEIDMSGLREVFEVNTFGVVGLYKAVYPLLKAASTASAASSGGEGGGGEGGKGCREGTEPMFIAISSAAGSLGALDQTSVFNMGAYGASKAAMGFLVRKAQFENEWINAFVMHPGLVQTDMGARGAAHFQSLGQSGHTWISVQESAEGMMKHIDGATREKTSGKFLSYDGSEVPL